MCTDKQTDQITILFAFPLNLSYIPSYMLVTEKSANLRRTLQSHVRFYNRMSRLHRSRHENCHAHYSLRAHSMHPYLKANLQETCTHAFSLIMLQVLPIHLQGVQVPYNTLAYTLHVYKPTDK